MSDQAINDFVPPEMLALAEQGVQQARKAFDEVMSATQHAVSTFEDQASLAKSNVREFQRKVVEFSERSVAASLEFAQKVLQAKDSEEMIDLHTEYVRAQIQALAEQAREIAEQAAKAAVPRTAAPPAAASQDPEDRNDG